MIKIGINFDEISDDLEESLAFMEENRVNFGEVRTINKRNFALWDSKEINLFNDKISSSNIKLVAAASPLFKWYSRADAPEIPHDSFGFNPRLSETEKYAAIRNTLDTAREIGVKRVRIFSELGQRNEAGKHFASSDLLGYALEQAELNDIDLYVENEPVCTVHSVKEFRSLFSENKHPRLKMWLDIANFSELNEEVTSSFMNDFADRIGYIHVKDFTRKQNTLKYVPVGHGEINYPEFFSLMAKKLAHEIIVTVETHAKSDKIESSRKSLEGVRSILDNIEGVEYE